MSENIKVLLAADTAEDRVTLNKLLALGNLVVLSEASLGPEAISLAKEFKPDVVLLSMEEPAARPLRTLEGMSLTNPECPVVVISSLSDRDHMRRAMVAGARDYVVKPPSVEDLRNAILGVLEVKRKRNLHIQDGSADSHQRGEIITVFGAKGGIGKTTLSTNLAVATALQTKQRVALLDLDIQFGDVALMLNVNPERTIADLVPMIEKVDLEMIHGYMTPHASGLDILAAPLRPEEGDAIAVPHIRRIVETISRGYDYVIVDTPPTFNDAVLTILDLSNLVLMVTTLEIPSIKRTKLSLAMMKGWHYPENKLKLVVNHTSNTNGLSNQDVEAAIDYPIFWKVPNDAAVSAAAKNGKPFVQAHPDAKISRNIFSLSGAISGVMPQARSFMARLKERA